MATIKSFTSLEQSRKLAKILPLESADMLIGNYVGKSGIVDGTNIHYYTKGETFGAPQIIEAWSLAALLRLMPKRHNNGNVYMPLVGRYYEGNHKFICGYFGDGLLDCTFGETSVDACYEMILKLHELKML